MCVLKNQRRALMFVVLLAAGASNPLAAESKDNPQSLPELRQAIETALQKHHVPAAGVALVSRDAVIWAEGIGLADVAAGAPAAADTLFRLGSVTKSFVSLAVLRLVEEGRLDLQARLQDLAPEIPFQNPWEDAYPVRLVHLLEHTSGFDDIHLPEYAHNDPTPARLLDALLYHPDSRVSRWRPGTAMSYCNSGPAIAGYIVAKTVGKSFEEYVQQILFDPLGMTGARFFLDDQTRANLAKGYEGDEAFTEAIYWHIGMRPAGAANASARDMAQFVRMMLNRGRLGDAVVVAPESLQRMETPETTLAARRGLRAGYGLGNYTSSSDGFLYHGHDGGVNAYLASYAYLPEQGLGYAFMINAASGGAYTDVQKLVRRYLTRDLDKKSRPAEDAPAAESLQPLAGYYASMATRPELAHFLDRLLNVVRVTVEDGRLHAQALFGEEHELVAAGENAFRTEDEPMAMLMFIPVADGEIVLQGAGKALSGSYRSVSGLAIWTQWLTAAACVALMLSAPLFALVWVPRKLLGRLPGVRGFPVRILPLISVLALLAGPVIVMLASDPIWDLGRLTPWSIALWLSGWLFAIFTVLSLMAALRAGRYGARRAVRIHSRLVALACTVVLVYLARFGIIGLRLWSD